MKFVASYSGGKDSILAINRAINAGNEPIGLITTYDEKNNHSWFHNISVNTLKEVSESLEIPINLIKTSGDEYALNFEKALLEMKENGAEMCVFGDIDIQEHLEWCDNRCKNVGIKSYFPLWQEIRKSLVNELIDSGFKALITVVDTSRMNQKYLGKILSKELVEQLELEGTDVCGENGEYHTIVYDGPIFKKAVELKLGKASKVKGYIRIPIL